MMMKIRLSELRKIVAEEVDRMIRRSAGFCMGSGVGGSTGSSINFPPPGLGDDSEETKYEKEQEDGQFATRVEKRRPRKG